MIRIFTLAVVTATAPTCLLSQLAAAQLDRQDAAKLAALGVRTLSSKHLTLYTDLPSNTEVDSLPEIFDQAIPQWASFFSVSTDVFSGWKVTACVIQDKQRFRRCGLLPDDLPPFKYGMQMIDRLWVYEQPSAYYRRHLLIHEGTHAAMNRIFGRVGPGWYREGLADMLGTHEFEGGKLTIPFFPVDKKRVEYWGRIKMIRDAVREGREKTVREVVNTQVRDFVNVESYAWTWALQSFGHRHPQFRGLFKDLQRQMYVSDEHVTHTFLRQYEARRREIDVAWRLFLDQLDYGYDSSQERIHSLSETRRLGSEYLTIYVDPAKGWQSTGLRIPANGTAKVFARGRYQLVSGDKPWMSEPQGVTIEYYQGRPLGVLMGAVLSSEEGNNSSLALSSARQLGRQGVITAENSGVLYLRVNERADRLSDNKGKITVKLKLDASPKN